MEDALDVVQAMILECFETAIQNMLAHDTDSCIAKVDKDELDDADSDEDNADSDEDDANDTQQHVQDARGEYHEDVQTIGSGYHKDVQVINGEQVHELAEYHQDVHGEQVHVPVKYHEDVQIVNGEQVDMHGKHHQDVHGEQIHKGHYHACYPLESLRAVVPAVVLDNKHAAGAMLESDRKGSEVFDRTYTNTLLEHHIVVEDMFEIVQYKSIEVSICADHVVHVMVDGKDGPYVRVHSDYGLVVPSPTQLVLFLKQLWE
ncbi:hypothetical protein AMAG_08990 [Allomyces macrogynus ATCC 38327]|uniref:Uncharacterized protein n=1 Tax=Allomyces macrogynus (strain ATCC 38327) TaxID=578462 RepID=A0A0L0SN55_ALLM3|nr:hypothetical protein AMAG_08990 [Allomyces macrogynus ATCC 38327]|eukprot:KNE63932.1 hypothetical protein AMAG_08990 [Allomyces macrogynus ATCC 38327]